MAVAVAEMAFAGGLGATLNLDAMSNDLPDDLPDAMRFCSSLNPTHDSHVRSDQNVSPAGLTETTAKAAAGALEFLPIVRVVNVNRALEQLKKAGFWTFGLDERGKQTIYEVDLDGKVALVLGAEGGGLHRLTAETCDLLVRIPMAGKIASLNVSVAAGVALFEVVRRRP